MKRVLLFSAFVLINFICKAQLPVAGFSVDDTVVCAGTCVSFTNLSTNATFYQWYFQNGIPSISYDQNPQSICFGSAGNFSVTLIASNSSGNDTIVDFLTVINGQVVQVNTSGDTIFADQGLIHYQWYLYTNPIPDDTLYYHVAMPDGTHFLEAIDTNGCEIGLTTFGPIIYPEFIPSDTEFCAGSCIDFDNITQWLSGDSAYATHQWYFNGATPSLSQDYSPQNICYNNPGTYQIKYVALAGIDSRSDSLMVNVISCTGVLENNSQQFSISPNPFSAELSLHFNNSRNSTALLRIFNSLGVAVLEKTIKLENQTFNLFALPKGIYFLMIESGDEISTQKILKE